MKKPENVPVPPKGYNLFTDQEIINIISNPQKMDILYNIERGCYPYWEEFKQKVKKKFEVAPEKLWFFLQHQRRSSSYTFFLSGNAQFRFKYNLNSYIQKQLHLFDMYGGGIIGGDFLPQENKNKLLVSSLMEEAIYSSILEGAVSTREKAKEMLLKEKTPGSIDEQMILNNYKTIQHLKEYKKEPLTDKLILQIHKQITDSTLEDKNDEGSYRNRD